MGTRFNVRCLLHDAFVKTVGTGIRKKTLPSELSVPPKKFQEE